MKDIAHRHVEETYAVQEYINGKWVEHTEEFKTKKLAEEDIRTYIKKKRNFKIIKIERHIKTIRTVVKYPTNLEIRGR